MRFLLPVLALVTTCAAHAQTWPSVATELPRAGGGENDVAVIVGVSRYFSLPEVPGAAENARDWQQHLVRVLGVPTDRTTLLVDGEATKERIERALKAAAAQAKPNGRAIVVFVGHGAPAPTGDDGLLLGVDTQADADSLSARGVAQANVAALLSTGKQRETVLVYDACFSGKTADDSAPLVPGNQATLPVRRVVKAPVGKVLPLVLSSSETFAGPLPGQKRPAFSYVLLGALRGWGDVDKDKAITVDEAFRFTQDTLRAALKQSGRMPQMRGEGAFVLARATTNARAFEDAPDVGAILLGRCPDGTRWAGRTCEAVACPNGTKFNGTACAATAAAVSCPAGTTWNGTTCSASSVACPKGTTWNGTACASTSVTCPAGTSWDGSACRSTVASAPVRVVEPARPVAPVERVVQRASGGDADGDGVADASDLCPSEPEDKDGHEDGDGCPDPDNDGDGVVDAHDKCPSQPEARNGFQDEDGCPDDMPLSIAKHLNVTKDRVLFVEPLQFQSAKATLKTASEPALRALGALLTSSGARAQIECHSDSAGDDGFNERLTQARADAVREWLVGAGVSANAIEAIGYGENKPIADNRTANGRAQNRRCEVHLR